MLTQVADGVLVHTSAFVLSNAVVAQGETGVLVVAPGITASEMECLADDVDRLGRPVVAAFSTHPDWDHVLWHPRLGAAPRYGTARNAAAMREQLADPGTTGRVAEHLLDDVFPPMLDVDDGPDPVEDYLAGLRLLDRVAGEVDAVVPGHGSVGDRDELRARIELDLAYVQALRDGQDVSDPRLGDRARPGWEWVDGIHEWQAERLAARRERGPASPV